jgi:stress-induced morphogen
LARLRLNGSGETHFAVDIVSNAFEGMRPVKRHQLVYSLLATEMEGGMDYK